MLARHDVPSPVDDARRRARHDPTVAALARHLVARAIRRMALRDRQHGSLGDARCRVREPRTARRAGNGVDAARRRRRGSGNPLMALATATLGSTGFEITRLGLGAWAIGGGEWQGGWGTQDDQQSVRAIHRAVELGINWIDTAAAY